MKFLLTLALFASLTLPTLAKQTPLTIFVGAVIEYVIESITPQRLIHGDKKYRETWSGAIHKDKEVSQAHARIHVPTISPGCCEDNKGDEWAGEAWIGIDGYPCRNGAAIRVGVSWMLNQTNTKYVAWSEWSTAPRVELALDVHAGNEIEFNVLAPTDAEGVAQVINWSTGERAEHTFHNQPKLLCRDRVEWIVSRAMKPPSNDGQPDLYPFANFHRISFKDPEYVSDKNGEHRSSFRAKLVKLGEIKWGFWRGPPLSVCKFPMMRSELVCAFRDTGWKFLDY